MVTARPAGRGGAGLGGWVQVGWCQPDSLACTVPDCCIRPPQHRLCSPTDCITGLALTEEVSRVAHDGGAHVHHGGVRSLLVVGRGRDVLPILRHLRGARRVAGRAWVRRACRAVWLARRAGRGTWRGVLHTCKSGACGMRPGGSKLELLGQPQACRPHRAPLWSSISRHAGVAPEGRSNLPGPPPAPPPAALRRPGRSA